MADQKFKITITADNAEAVSKIKELAKSLDGVKTSSGNVGKAQESMATSVFKGVAAWDMLKKGVSMATDFIWSSVKAAAEAERQMAVVKTNVENAGLSYASISPKLKSYSESMIKMGFDNEDTAVSVSRMITVTRDYDKALTMTHLAMDLARNKNIDLATATTLVTQVANGNNKVLKQYSIELSDSASAADNLTTLQGKLKNSTEAYANTGAGKLEIMNVQWEDMKKQVGEALSPAVSDLFTVFEDNLPAITTLVGTLASALGTMAKVAISIAGPLNEAFAWIG